MQQRWNVLYVKHNHEKAASRFLAANDVDHYLPLYAEQSVWLNRRKVVVERPIYPGYLFVRFAPEQRRKVLMAPGVVCLMSDNKFGAITGTEVAQLRKAVARGEKPQLPRSLDLFTPSSPRWSILTSAVSKSSLQPRMTNSLVC
jgi:transcription antitermination factor NusG